MIDGCILRKRATCGFLFPLNLSKLSPPKQLKNSSRRKASRCIRSASSYIFAVRIGPPTHNADAVCTTSTRVEMQLISCNLAIWVTRGDELREWCIIWTAAVHDIRHNDQARKTKANIWTRTHAHLTVVDTVACTWWDQRLSRAEFTHMPTRHQ